VALFHFPDHDGEEELVTQLHLDATGWRLRFDHAATVDSGSFDGAWASLLKAPLAKELADGAHVAVVGRNLGAGRGSGRVERVLVTSCVATGLGGSQFQRAHRSLGPSGGAKKSRPVAGLG